MAKQTGILDIKGTLGGITFYQTKAGRLARTKSNLTRQRVRTDPAFSNSRLSAGEFGKASSSGSLIRQSFRIIAREAKDGSTHYRLNSLLGNIIRSDHSSPKGERHPANISINQLIDFQWNEDHDLDTLFKEKYTTQIGNTSGDLHISIPSFLPATGLAAPTGATHFRFISGASALDFLEEKESHTSATSDYLPVNADPTQPQSFTFSLTPVSGQVMMLGLGILFYQHSSSKYYLLKEKTAFAIVDLILVP